MHAPSPHGVHSFDPSFSAYFPDGQLRVLCEHTNRQYLDVHSAPEPKVDASKCGAPAVHGAPGVVKITTRSTQTHLEHIGSVTFDRYIPLGQDMQLPLSLVLVGAPLPLLSVGARKKYLPARADDSEDNNRRIMAQP